MAWQIRSSRMIRSFLANWAKDQRNETLYGSHLQASQSFHWLSFKERCFFLVEEGWLSKPWPPYTNLWNPIKQLPRSTTPLSQLFGVSTLKALVWYLLRDCQGDLKALSPSLPWSTTCSPQSFHYNIKVDLRVWNGARPHGPCLPCPLLAFCLWKKFLPTSKFNQESKNMKKERKTVKGDQAIIV